ncbi:Calx-beta domain-containing protein [Candidatus Poriferisodalis sp.]|uniref:Calx-beta domain-containing protein n=1 Tax=Candidatus Poriferisodalis sp. TaxID=3101277 RepID=UPI003B51E23D
MARHVARIFPHLRLRIWRSLALVAIITSALVVAPASSGAQQNSEQSIADCISDSLVATVRGYYEANKNKPPGYGENWKRVLIAFGDVSDGNLTPFTEAEARAEVQRWYGWKPVQEALKCIETANPPPPDPEISIAAGSGVTEGTAASFTLTASPSPASALTVSVAVAQSGDFGVTTGARTVTIPTGGSYTLTVDTTGDSTDEPDGSVTVSVSSGTGYTVSSSNSSATVSVSDDDDAPPPPPPPADCVSDETLESARDYYELHRDRAPGYGRNWRRVLIAFGDVADDQLTAFTAAEALEGEQRWFGWKPFREALECIEAASQKPPPVPEVSVTAGIGVTEGSAASFTVTASPVPTAALTVDVTVSQSGDFGVATGARTVTIPTGGSYTLAVTTTGDSTDEADGSVTVSIDTGTGYTVSSSAGSAMVAVADNDPAAQPAQTNSQPTVSIADASSNEGDGVGFVVSVSPVQSSAIALDYQTADGTAIAHSDVDDYTAASGTVTIPAGSSSATITISTTEDSDIEIDDEFTVTISNPPAGVTISDDTATGTIRNDDTGSKGAAYHSDNKYIRLDLAQDIFLTVWEDGQKKPWQFRLKDQPPHAITVRPVIQGARNARSLDISPDYLVFTPSNWNEYQTIRVLHLGDWGSIIATAQVSLEFVEYPGYAAISDLWLSMYGVDRSNPITQRKPNPNLLAEGDPASSLTYQLKLGRIPRNPVTVTITNPDPGAVTVTPTSLVFNHENYDEFQDVTITPVADSDNDDEDVVITVTIPVPHPENAQVKVRALTETFRVAVEDRSPGVLVDPQSLTVDEGTTAHYEVWLRADPGSGKSVIVTPTFTGSDVTVSPTTLTFTGGSTGNWQTRQRITVTAVRDPDGTDEIVAVSHVISGDGDGYSAQSPSQTLTVNIDDNEAVEMTLSASTVAVDELSSTTYDLSLNADPGDGASIVITPVSSDTDRLTVSGPLTFTGGSSGNWNSAQTVTLNAPLDDNYIKDTVTITHAISGFAGVSAMPSVTATIADARPVYVTWTPDPAGEKIAPNSTLNLTEGTPGAVYLHFDPALLKEGKFKDDWFDRMAKGYQGLTGDGIGPYIAIWVGGVKNFYFTAASAGENCDGKYPRPRSINAKYCDTIPVKSDIDADTNDETRWLEFRVDNFPGLSYAAPRRLTVKIEDTSISMQAWPSALFPIEDVAASQDVWVRLRQKPEPGVTVTVQPEIKSSDSTKLSVAPGSLTFDASDWDTFKKFTVTALSDADTANEDISFKLKGTASDSKVVVLDANIGVTVLDDD